MMDAAARLNALPRVRLCWLPTPITRLERLERALGLEAGPELWIKRDDLTGLAFGGNKGRKLEFSLAEAQALGADVVLTTGGVQSNHCRQTAVAAAALGLEAHLFLKGDRPERLTGNLIPSHLCGATLHFIGAVDPFGGTPPMERFAEELRAEGHRPYVIPTGASNATGAMGYVQAVREIMDQERELGVTFDRIFHAAGSMGTQAGLVAGRRVFGLKAAIAGVAVSPMADPAARPATASVIASDVLHRLGEDCAVTPAEVAVLTGFEGEAYAVPTEPGEAALRLLARYEGIFLDPVYTAKTMAGMLESVRTGTVGPAERVLFIHTGGNLALFA